MMMMTTRAEGVGKEEEVNEQHQATISINNGEYSDGEGRKGMTEEVIIPHHIVEVSSEDPDHPASQLDLPNNQRGSSKHSSRYETYHCSLCDTILVTFCPNDLLLSKCSEMGLCHEFLIIVITMKGGNQNKIVHIHSIS